MHTISFLIVSVAALQAVNGLQCWKCTSEFDITCRDFFNVTRIRENRRFLENVNYSNRQQTVRNEPHLEVCDEMFTSSYGQKNVCLKRVTTTSTGVKIVNRECRLVSANLKPGYCPEDLYNERRHTNDYCGTCDYDGCNSANNYKNNVLTLIVPTVCALIFRK